VDRQVINYTASGHRVKKVGNCTVWDGRIQQHVRERGGGKMGERGRAGTGTCTHVGVGWASFCLLACFLADCLYACLPEATGGQARWGGDGVRGRSQRI